MEKKNTELENCFSKKMFTRKEKGHSYAQRISRMASPFSR
jgi:hypothetical protein